MRQICGKICYCFTGHGHHATFLGVPVKVQCAVVGAFLVALGSWGLVKAAVSGAIVDPFGITSAVLDGLKIGVGTLGVAAVWRSTLRWLRAYYRALQIMFVVAVLQGILELVVLSLAISGIPFPGDESRSTSAPGIAQEAVFIAMHLLFVLLGNLHLGAVRSLYNIVKVGGTGMEGKSARLLRRSSRSSSRRASEEDFLSREVSPLILGVE